MMRLSKFEMRTCLSGLMVQKPFKRFYLQKVSFESKEIKQSQDRKKFLGQTKYEKQKDMRAQNSFVCCSH